MDLDKFLIIMNYAKLIQAIELLNSLHVPNQSNDLIERTRDARWEIEKVSIEYKRIIDEWRAS